MFCMLLFNFVYYVFFLLCLCILIVFHCVVLCIVVLFVCKCVLLPPGVNPIAGNEYIISYQCLTHGIVFFYKTSSDHHESS